MAVLGICEGIFKDGAPANISYRCRLVAHKCYIFHPWYAFSIFMAYLRSTWTRKLFLYKMRVLEYQLLISCLQVDDMMKTCHNIGRTEATNEVLTDVLVEKVKNPNDALLWVLGQRSTEYTANEPAKIQEWVRTVQYRDIMPYSFVYNYNACISLQVGGFVDRLLKRGANVGSVGLGGNTPLHLAAFRGFHNIAKKLLDEGAVVDALNDDHKTALEIAASNSHCEFTVLMINHMSPAR